MTRADIVREARTWLGVRWRHQGRTRDGIDCAGLVIKVAHGCGLTDFDTADYGRVASDESMMALCREHLLPVTTLQPGDVVVMAFENQRHMAIVGDYPQAAGEVSIIHAYALGRRCVIEQRLDSVWARRIIGRFSFPQVQ